MASGRGGESDREQAKGAASSGVAEDGKVKTSLQQNHPNKTTPIEWPDDGHSARAWNLGARSKSETTQTLGQGEWSYRWEPP